MSWLSKWWRGGGREAVRDSLIGAVDEDIKNEVVARLRLLLDKLDGIDVSRIRQELAATIEYVEEM